ncbi:hypothetical protein ACH6EH_11470 [Paenibacillus sp. JSM ZJ436]
MEIKALAPEVVVFLMGPDYDDRLRATYERDEEVDLESVAHFASSSFGTLIRATSFQVMLADYNEEPKLRYNDKALVLAGCL